MTDYISREAPKEYIEREEAEKRLFQRAEIANSAYIDQTPCQIMMLAQNVVHLIPAADVRPRWIPVTEQLIHSGWYLVACNEWGGSAVRKAIYDEATRKWLEFPCGGPKDITKFVTHYMPLPEPPKEE